MASWENYLKGGDALTPPLPGHSIPYQFSLDEADQFLADYAGNQTLQNYLDTQQPAYGVIIQGGYGQVLVWFDAHNFLHVVDVTNTSIAHQIQQAPYVSPDDTGVAANLMQSLQQFINNLPTGGQVAKMGQQAIGAAALIAAAVILVKISR